MPHNRRSSTHRPSRVSHVASHVNHAPQRAVEHASPVSHVPRCLTHKPCPTTGGQARTARLAHPALPLTSPLHKPHPTMGGRACTARLTCPHPSLNSRVCKIKYISNIYCC